MPERDVRLTTTLADRYRIEHELGSGGMATVYLAHDLKHDRQVAVKVLKPELAEWLGVDRFLAEIRTTARLRHPHILPLFDSGEADGLLYYVMPLVEGTSLRDRLDRDGPLPVEDALRITREVADALSHAHAHDIVHRDIKPENILLEGSHALVVDFGIARVLREVGNPHATQAGLRIGTPLYMSPEQASGDTVVDGRSDLYSLASVLFEMLTGAPPFTGSTAEAILVQRFTMPAPRASGLRKEVPAYVDSAIHRALARQPDDRPASVERFVAMLQEGVTRPASTDQKSIAVLPFANMSANPDNEYFSDGISEDIINALTRLGGLRVAARTSAFSFKGKNADLRTIGDVLNVATVLEGSVRRVGNRLRITAQLGSTSDGYHLWSERYDRDVTDVFAVQDEIANAIAAKLQLTFAETRTGRNGPTATAHVAAYELYLKARALIAKRGRPVLDAIQYLEQAVALDPGFAPAHGALGEAIRLSAWFGLVRHAEAIPKAKAAIGRALELDPDSTDALGARAIIAIMHDRDAVTAFACWERALSLNPMLSEMRGLYAAYGLCVWRGDDARAIAEADRAVSDDPMGYAPATIRAGALGLIGRHAEAIAEAHRAIALDGEAFLPRLGLSWVCQFAGDWDNALSASNTALLMSGRSTQILAGMSAIHSARGDRRRALGAHQEIMTRSAIDIVDPTFLALSALGIGAADEALEHAFRAVEERAPNQIWLVRRPGTEALHAHTRYPELRRRMGL